MRPVKLQNRRRRLGLGSACVEPTANMGSSDGLQWVNDHMKTHKTHSELSSYLPNHPSQNPQVPKGLSKVQSPVETENAKAGNN